MPGSSLVNVESMSNQGNAIIRLRSQYGAPPEGGADFDSGIQRHGANFLVPNANV